MAEYYAVLSKAVAGLEANSADTRRAVYDKARNALIGQLKAIDPPLPTAEISRQRLELEEAIRRVERETSTAPGGAPARVTGSRPASEQAPRQSPQDVFRRAIQEAERDNPDSPRLERAPVTARVDDWSSERTERPPPARPTQQYLPSQGYVEDEQRADEPRLAPDYDYEWDPNAKPQAEERPGAPYVDNRDRSAKARRAKRGKNDDQAAQGARVGDDHDTMEQKARPSRLPTILLIVLIIAMVGGLGALGWSQRALLADVLGQFDSGSQTPPVVTVEQPVDPNAKDTDRLLPGQTAPADTVRVIAPDGAAADGAATGTQAAGTDAAAANQNTVDADALVAQRAVLYEEPLDSAAAASGVVAINAAVTWSFVQGTDGAEIVGNIDVPERAMKLKITMRRNIDQTLPASHLVEVVIEAPASFPGKGIRDVPRLVLKPSEEARGQPLIGASAKVADGFFWIGLSSEAPDIASNLKLLKERTWIDLPLVYETGQRAILTFEKGTPGERVFERALTAWTG